MENLGRLEQIGVISDPADPFYVAIYLNDVLFMFIAKGSIITAFYGIKWGHHVMGFNSPADNPFAQLSKRLCETETTKKERITSSTDEGLSYEIRWRKFQYSGFYIFINMFVSVRRTFTYRGIT